MTEENLFSKRMEKLQSSQSTMEGLLTSISDSCCLRDSVVCRFLFLRNIYESSISAVVPINLSLGGICERGATKEEHSFDHGRANMLQCLGKLFKEQFRLSLIVNSERN